MRLEINTMVTRSNTKDVDLKLCLIAKLTAIVYEIPRRASFFSNKDELYC